MCYVCDVASLHQEQFKLKQFVSISTIAGSGSFSINDLQRVVLRSQII